MWLMQSNSWNMAVLFGGGESKDVGKGIGVERNSP